ncbi:hypothetical protein [Acinetobacter sp. Marseille-Q1618]|uniref:hypothetical protein n=1 Tax=Acinetobacter sp. Marseille-Q1618 TaxID=2697502 RepID=UPI00156DA051|nr:hypothetical protein [Acinetobacter sp. Marseille-Q1618]
MLLFKRKSQEVLQYAIRNAVMSRRSEHLKNLLKSHGSRHFAHALSGLSSRIIADVLTMLSVSERNNLLNGLSSDAYQRLLLLDQNMIQLLVNPSH